MNQIQGRTVDLEGETNVVRHKGGGGDCVWVEASVSFSAWIVRCVVLACCGFLSVHLLIYRLKLVFLGEDPYLSRVISHIFGEMQ